jgi:hypothetical protein
MPKSRSSSRSRSGVTSIASHGLPPVELNGMAGHPVIPKGIAVRVSGLTPAVIEGRPHWPPVAVATWLEAARALGADAADRTYEQIDSLRDGDDCYAGTVKVGLELLDLYVDVAGVLRVAPEDRYLG